MLSMRSDAPKLLLIAIASLLICRIWAFFFPYLWLTAFNVGAAPVQWIVILGCVVCSVGFWIVGLKAFP